MAKTSRADVIKQMHKVLKKHFTAVAPPKDRSILEHLLFACLLENARHEVAEASFARIQQLYYDWNEIRVTTVKELSEALRELPEPQQAASRLKATLQSVFETLYRFDLEDLRKLKLSDAAKRLESFKGPSAFTIAYVVQHGLGGHSIPLCRGAMEVCYVVGAASRAEIDAGNVPGLERAVPKAKGTEFASLLHSVGAEWIIHPKSPKLRAILTEIASDAGQRITELTAGEASAKASAEESTEQTKKGAAKKREPKPKKAAGGTTEGPKASKAKKKAADSTPKEPAKGAKPASKQLARRKPR